MLINRRALTFTSAVVIGLVILSVLVFNPFKGNSNLIKLPTADAAQVDYFLKIPDVPGESQSDGHREEIDVLSWSWGFNRPGSSSLARGAVGRPTTQDFTFSMETNKSTPKLMEFCADGKHLDKVDVFARRSAQSDDFMTISFFDVFFNSFEESGETGDIPTEEVSFTYQKVVYTYRPTLADGSLGDPVTEGWDFRLGRPFTPRAD